MSVIGTLWSGRPTTIDDSRKYSFQSEHVVSHPGYTLHHRHDTHYSQISSFQARTVFIKSVPLDPSGSTVPKGEHLYPVMTNESKKPNLQANLPIFDCFRFVP